jgi:RND family efflux transporter MFP subunit
LSEKRLKIFLPIVILALGIVITAIMVKSRGPLPTRPQREYTPLVRTLQVHPQHYELRVPAQGTVKPRTETSLVSEVAGRIVDVAPTFAAGGFFSKGDVLLRVDARDYELAVVTARGVVAQAKVAAEIEEAQAEVARKEWEELGDGEASPLATRELQLQQARAALASAEASLERAKRDLARTRVTAPFDGRIRAKLVDIGQYVAPGIPVANIFAVDYVEVRLPIHDAELAYLDMPVNFSGNPHADDGPEVILSADFAGAIREWRGRIVRVEGEIDPLSRMVNVVAQVDDPYGRAGEGTGAPLVVGLFVEAEIIGRRIENAMVVPRSALRGEDQVLVVDSESKLRFRDVDVLRVTKSEAVITGGIDAGERVCVSLLEAVTDGMKVRIAGADPEVERQANRMDSTASGGAAGHDAGEAERDQDSVEEAVDPQESRDR